MKYIYKATGIMVESDGELDSILFEPVKDMKKPQNTAKEEEKPKKSRKKKV